MNPMRQLEETVVKMGQSMIALHEEHKKLHLELIRSQLQIANHEKKIANQKEEIANGKEEIANLTRIQRDMLHDFLANKRKVDDEESREAKKQKWLDNDNEESNDDNKFKTVKCKEVLSCTCGKQYTSRVCFSKHKERCTQQGAIAIMNLETV